MNKYVASKYFLAAESWKHFEALLLKIAQNVRHFTEMVFVFLLKEKSFQMTCCFGRWFL